MRSVDDLDSESSVEHSDETAKGNAEEMLIVLDSLTAILSAPFTAISMEHTSPRMHRTPV